MIVGYHDELTAHTRQIVFNPIISSEEGADWMEEKKSWRIDDPKEALLAGLPMVLYGLAVSATWWIIGGPWYQAMESTLRKGLVAGLALSALIAFGGILAILKRFPDWGFTWLGVDILGFLLVVKSAAEEGVLPISDTVGMIILLPALVFGAWLFVLAARRSWQAAGLISIGMSTAMSLSNVHLMAIGPFHRVDLAILGLVFGLAFAGLTYFYVQGRQLVQGIILLAIALLNIALTWLANSVWSQHLADIGAQTPFIPMVVILCLIILAVPLARVFRTLLQKLFKPS